MFNAEERLPVVREMIMAGNEEERRAALDLLLPIQQGDFEGIFEAMAGLPVTIRLLDPPLHEFLPDLEDATSDAMRERIKQLREANPMLGTRGCRLAVLYPEVYEMQVRAIVGAALAVRARAATEPQVEIMIPLVDYEQELQMMRALVENAAARAIEEAGAEPLHVSVGTMIELPRACMIAELIADHADFFSFGTNDLTQTVLGFSRDDAESGFLTEYLEQKIVQRSPFETLDVLGVGELVRQAVERGRSTNAGLKLGICGEHGGDPDSIEFFDNVGLDYVSCSPFRVPIARVAAAQAAIRHRS
jgi:pyruvate,orthophosphate dikinase